MRAVAALAVLAAFACAGQAASAKTTVSVPIHVHLKVPSTCTVRTPEIVRLDANGVPVLSPKSVLTECTDDEAPTVALSVRADPIDKGTDVATINF